MSCFVSYNQVAAHQVDELHLRVTVQLWPVGHQLGCSEHFSAANLYAKNKQTDTCEPEDEGSDAFII